jgi:large repetitive protein
LPCAVGQTHPRAFVAGVALPSPGGTSDSASAGSCVNDDAADDGRDADGDGDGDSGANDDGGGEYDDGGADNGAGKAADGRDVAGADAEGSDVAGADAEGSDAAGADAVGNLGGADGIDVDARTAADGAGLSERICPTAIR